MSNSNCMIDTVQVNKWKGWSSEQVSERERVVYVDLHSLISSLNDTIFAHSATVRADLKVMLLSSLFSFMAESASNISKA